MLRTPLIAFVLGTRPEAIKLAPVIVHARKLQPSISSPVITTGQHADLVDGALATFGLAADTNLQVMRPGQQLSDLTARCLMAVARALRTIGPQCVVVQGDTASAWAGAMAAFLEHLPVAHVEAGLRTGDLGTPFPEEAFRQLVSRVATIHFAPTLAAKANLMAEGIDAESIVVTGNTIVDAVEMLRGKISEAVLPVAVAPSSSLVVVTVHRRENLGPPLQAICRAVIRLASERSDVHVAFITHPNPDAAQTVERMLADRPGVTLLPPLSYLETLKLLAAAAVVLTDSGGIQEEAPSFACPVLVLRERTERVEGIASGTAWLVGTDTNRIVHEALRALASGDRPRSTATANPYGDGQAAGRIISTLLGRLCNNPACHALKPWRRGPLKPSARLREERRGIEASGKRGRLRAIALSAAPLAAPHGIAADDSSPGPG